MHQCYVMVAWRPGMQREVTNLFGKLARQNSQILVVDLFAQVFLNSFYFLADLVLRTKWSKTTSLHLANMHKHRLPPSNRGPVKLLWREDMSVRSHRPSTKKM